MHGPLATLDEGNRAAVLYGGGRDLATDESRADHRNAGPGNQLGAKRQAIFDGSHHVAPS